MEGINESLPEGLIVVLPDQEFRDVTNDCFDAGQVKDGGVRQYGSRNHGDLMCGWSVVAKDSKVDQAMGRRVPRKAGGQAEAAALRRGSRS